MQRVWATGAGLVALLAAGTASAQDVTTVPAPSIEQFNLPPNRQATPTPSPTPAPTPAATLTPAPLPSVVPTIRRLATVATATPTPAPTRTPARTTLTPTPTPAPAQSSPATPSAVSAPAPAPAVPPTAEPTPEVTSGPPAPDTPPATATSGPPSWLWWAIGAAVLALGLFLARKRIATRAEEPEVAYAPPLPAPAPAPQPAPRAPSPSPPARPLAATPQPDRALVLDFRPQRLWTIGPDAHLAFELVVSNRGATAIDAVRPVIALASAGPATTDDIARFSARSQTLPSAEPFTLAAGDTRSLVGELTLAGDAMYVTSAADRELIVPLALVALHWRAGLSVARATEAFVIGTGDAGTPKLGPIWVDRPGLVYARLHARRFSTQHPARTN